MARIPYEELNLPQKVGHHFMTHRIFSDETAFSTIILGNIGVIFMVATTIMMITQLICALCNWDNRIDLEKYEHLTKLYRWFVILSFIVGMVIFDFILNLSLAYLFLQGGYGWFVGLGLVYVIVRGAASLLTSDDKPEISSGASAFAITKNVAIHLNKILASQNKMSNYKKLYNQSIEKSKSLWKQQLTKRY